MLLRIAFILIIALQLNVHGQSDLEIQVSGIKAIQGNLYISLYDKGPSWMYTDSAFRKVMVPVSKEVETISIKNLPEGDYAIAIYQDLNGNESMDETEMKIPREPFGFSNNPKGMRGPASFEQAMFHCSGQDTIRIELVNNIFTPNKEKNEKPK